MLSDDGRSEWHDGLMCWVTSAIYFFASRVCRIDVPRNNCTDMRGAIKLARRFSMKVDRIEVYSDGVLDSLYIRDDLNKWDAKDCRSIVRRAPKLTSVNGGIEGDGVFPITIRRVHFTGQNKEQS